MGRSRCKPNDYSNEHRPKYKPSDFLQRLHGMDYQAVMHKPSFAQNLPNTSLHKTFMEGSTELPATSRSYNGERACGD